MTLSTYLDTFAHDIGLDDRFIEDQPGVYKIPLEEDLEITITSLDKGFQFFSVLCSCPPNNREKFFTQTLLGNLFGQGTHGAVLGLNQDASKVTLTRTADFDMDYRTFKNILEDFINSADAWREIALTHVETSK